MAQVVVDPEEVRRFAHQLKAGNAQLLDLTARLLGVNVWHYLYDRCSLAYQMPALTDLVRQHAAHAALALGTEAA